MSTPSTAVSKPLMIALGAVVALAALFFLVIDPMLLSAENEAETGLAVVPGSAAAASPAPAASDEPSQEPAPETFEVYSVRDPFQQLVQIAPVASATATPTPQPSDSGEPQATAAATSSTVTTVSLDAVGTDEGVQTASVTVDGATFDVAQGDTITGSVRLLAVAGQCGTFADGAEQFTLCQGEEITR